MMHCVQKELYKYQSIIPSIVFSCLKQKLALLLAEFYRVNIVLNKICSKVNELDEEKMKTEEALHDFLPVSVVRSMKVRLP